MISLKQRFDSVVQAAHASHRFPVEFHDGASPEEIRRVEQSCHWKFPAELIEFLQFANGETETSEGILSSTRFCSIDQMIEIHQQMIGIEPNLINYHPEERQLVARNQFINPDRRWWRHWIPIGSTTDHANILFLDPQPYQSNLEMQLFWYFEESACGPPVATSLEGFFSAILFHIEENGRCPHYTKFEPITE